jgi:hypothetical protein
MFWDRLLRRIYYTFRESLSDDLTPAAQIVSHAHQLGLLNLVALDDLSILLLTLMCPWGTLLRQQADAEFLGRGLHFQPEHVWQLLSTSPPPRLDEILALGHGGIPPGRADPCIPHRRGVVIYILCSEHPEFCLETLQQFLARLYFEDPSLHQRRAFDLLVQALARFQSIPLGTIDFHCRLYRHFFLHPNQPAPLPVVYPAPPGPAWLEILDLSERQFLQASLGLPVAQRILIYLAFYGQLNLYQIRCVLASHQRYTKAEVIAHLLGSWQLVLGNMAIPP